MVSSSASTQFLTNHRLALPADSAASGDLGGRDAVPALPQLWRPTAAGLSRVADALMARRDLWLHIARGLADADPAAPTRIAALSGWEAWLHVWPAGASSGWHRHAGPTATAVVAGRLRELRDTGSPGPTGSAGAGRHALVNDAPEPAVTLQVYGPEKPFSARAQALLCRPARCAPSARSAAARSAQYARRGSPRDAREAS